MKKFLKLCAFFAAYGLVVCATLYGLSAIIFLSYPSPKEGDPVREAWAWVFLIAFVLEVVLYPFLFGSLLSVLYPEKETKEEPSDSHDKPE